MRFAAFFRRVAGPGRQAAPSADANAARDDAAGHEVAGLLRWYAVRTLSPDARALARVRAATLAAVNEHTSDSQSREAGPARPRAPGRARWLRPRIVAAGAATAILLAGAVGLAAAESGPGQPFYHVRLNLEAVSLPQPGSQSRLDADLARAQSRLDEIVAETGGRDWNGAADAAAAYKEVLDSMAAPTDQATLDVFRRRLGDQLARLGELRSHSEEPARNALSAAIARVDDLLGLNGSPPPAGSTSPSGEPTGSGGDRSAGPTDSGHDRSQGPTDSDASAGPGISGDPDPTPRAGTTDSGGDPGGRSPTPAGSGKPDPTPGDSDRPSGH